MIIKNYEIILNDNNMTCAFVLGKEYVLPFKKDEIINYEIFPEKKEIKVFSKNNSITFSVANDEIIYYAYKTDNIVIFIGSLRPEKKIKKIFIAQPI